MCYIYTAFLCVISVCVRCAAALITLSLSLSPFLSLSLSHPVYRSLDEHDRCLYIISWRDGYLRVLQLARQTAELEAVQLRTELMALQNPGTDDAAQGAPVSTAGTGPLATGKGLFTAFVENAVSSVTPKKGQFTTRYISKNDVAMVSNPAATMGVVTKIRLESSVQTLTHVWCLTGIAGPAGKLNEVTAQLEAKSTALQELREEAAQRVEQASSSSYLLAFFPLSFGLSF